MQEIKLQVIGTRVIIDFGGSKVGTETLEERVREILPLLFNLLSADSALRILPNSTHEHRLRAWAAIEMTVQAALLSAINQAELLVAIGDGSERISDHGFPEFQDDMS